jgi:hypothetical protein
VGKQLDADVADGLSNVWNDGWKHGGIEKYIVAKKQYIKLFRVNASQTHQREAPMVAPGG